MAEYIDKKQAIDRIASCYCMDCEHSNGILCRACEHQDDMDLIDDIPAANAQPVKCGHWDYSEKENGECEWYFCSECDSPAEQLYTDEPLLSEFCPHCGADMRGEQNDRV